MSTLSVRLPTSLHRSLRELAAREGVSMNQLISSAVGEKLAALMTEDYLSRASRGTRRAFAAVLRRVPNADPQKGDELSNNRMQLTRSARARAATRRPRS
jgi:HicB-like protein involved in pilus formation